jgi:preprotein translocase subunit SecD
MKRNLLWRGILILAVALIAVALAYPPTKKINLGLDLKGGMHLVLQVHVEDALRAETDSDMSRLLTQAQEAKLTGIQGHRLSDNSFEVTGVGLDSRDTVNTLAEKYLGSNWSTQSQEGRLVFTMRPEAAGTIEDLAVTQAKQTIENRVNAFGVVEPVVQTGSHHRIIVQLPGIDDAERVRALIKNTAFLEFRIVQYPPSGGGTASQEQILQHYNNQLPADLEIMEGDQRNADNVPVGKQYYAVERRRQVTGRDLKTARPGMGQFNQPIVEFSLTPDGATKFGQLTGANVGKPLAIVLDGRVVSAPNIHSQINDNGQIEGGFTQQQAQDLSTVLRSGALPAGITYLEERTVGPSLGRDSIQEGLRAGVVGTMLVILAMLIFYRLSGVNAIAALLLNILILFGGMGMMHSTLTLPGIAGVILTIGMAVDANVLVFERIREEMHAGRTVRSAIDTGFERAFTSIIDTHVTTLISALFLFQFGTGPIKGFAVTLTVGLLASLFTAVFVSHWIFDFVLSRRKVQKLSI